VFLSYRHSSDETSDVTFNLKDFKALLSLCDHVNANVAIYFDRPGSPLVAELCSKGGQVLFL
jgi:Rad9